MPQIAKTERLIMLDGLLGERSVVTLDLDTMALESGISIINHCEGIIIAIVGISQMTNDPTNII